MPRPSFGCSNCRARRIKCDERENGCLNCELYGNVCPGYPDRFDVLLRLQTPVENQPLQGALFAEPGAQSGSSIRNRTDINEAYMRRVALQVDPQLTDDPDMIALALFYTNNCIDGPILLPLEQIQAQGNGCMFAAIKALSSIDIQKRWLVPDRSRLLTESYSSAIQKLNLALASPDESRKDSTLMAVLIMSAIEMRNTTSVDTAYWDAHTQGAAALLQMRGAQQVTSQLGAALFFQVSSQILTNCIVAKRPVPRDLYQLRDAARVYVVDERDTSWRFQGAMLGFADFLAKSQDRIASPEQARAVIIDALEIYSEMSSVFADAGPDWHYQTLPSARFPSLLNYEHSYNTVLATQYWNGYRIAVISLCTVALRSGNEFRNQLELPPNAGSFLDSAATTINRAALDVIAAIPQGVAKILFKTGASDPNVPMPSICSKGYSHHKPVFYEADPGDKGLPHMHGCMIQWSLYFGIQSEFIEPRARRCLLDILETSGRTTETKQWQILAEQLRPVIENLPE